ncbi:uncharacterized protein HKW66_Vig0218190 [Vigna angularis]|uniref:Uncharacterized protein n=1 Tax=Phaseolus angularis TaxID=3914 RepID=A0A8T0JH76_PHAAN|nr:uncharacterized protein HKW66_Vig0218190 [Vigna angularis]
MFGATLRNSIAIDSAAMPEAPKQLCHEPKELDDGGSNSSMIQENKRALEYIEEVTRNADEIQEKIIENFGLEERVNYMITS